jgi:hypothetical protein
MTDDTTTELIDRKQSCIWLKESICKIDETKPCDDDCSLKTLDFTKESIEKRMKEEEVEIQRLKKEGMFRNRNKIKDKVMGVYVLQKTLKSHFNVIEPHVVDVDLEKVSFPTKGWRTRPQ